MPICLFLHCHKYYSTYEFLIPWLRHPFFCWGPLEETGLGGKGGGQCWMRTIKMVLAGFHIFLKSLMLEKPISFLRQLASFWKCILQTGPTDWKHKCVLQYTIVLCQSKHICVLNQNTFVFCHTPGNCYHICRYYHANNSKYLLYKRWPPPTSAAPFATVGTMLAPPSPLPWLPCCRRHCRRRHCHCHCHGCRCLHHHQYQFRCYCCRFLVLPFCFLCFGHHCLPSSLLMLGCRRHCHCRRGHKPLPPAPSATTALCSKYYI